MRSFLDFLLDQLGNLGLSLLLLVVVLTARALVLRALIPRLDGSESVFRARKVTLYVSVAVILLGLGWVWTHTLGGVGSFIGILSAGVAIALSDVLKNLAGWAYILVRRPFKAGDRIEIGPHAGDVIDIRVFRFSLLEIRNWVQADQSTGRILHIPNGLLFTDPMANFTEGFPFIWHEIPVVVTFESDWERAKRIVQEVIDRHAPDPEEAGAAEGIERAATQYFIRYRYLTPTVYVRAIDFGVELTGRLLVDARSRRHFDTEIWSDVLRAFTADPRIELAYPTTRFYQGDKEGGVGAAPGWPFMPGPATGEPPTDSVT